MKAFFWFNMGNMGKNGLSNTHLLKELKKAKDEKLIDLFILGSHAIIQIISEYIYGKEGLGATKFFLKKFVDGDTTDLKFSLISNDIHNWRNVIAHQYYSQQGHNLIFKDDMSEGWKKEKEILYININIYAEQFFKVFKRNIFYKYWKQLPKKVQIKNKYKFILNFLRLDKSDPIANEIKNLNVNAIQEDFEKQEEKIKQLIYERYELKK